MRSWIFGNKAAENEEQQRDGTAAESPSASGATAKPEATRS
jgi:hypothetical protein